MAWEMLREDYKDAVWDGLKKYAEVRNPDGTVSFRDVTVYTVFEEAFFGAIDTNRINAAVNAIMRALENGTNLYDTFVRFFEVQQKLFLEESAAKQDGFSTNLVTLQATMAANWEAIKADYAKEIKYFEDVQENTFNVWFQMIRDQLTSDAAGSLQNQITSLLTRIEAEEERSQESLQLIGSEGRALTAAQENIMRIKVVLDMITTAGRLDYRNAIVEVFDDADAVTIQKGFYDAANKRLAA